MMVVIGSGWYRFGRLGFLVLLRTAAGGATRCLLNFCTVIGRTKCSNNHRVKPADAVALCSGTLRSPLGNSCLPYYHTPQSVTITLWSVFPDLLR